MIKKLVALLLLTSAAHAFSPVRYVQISTNTLSQQSGAINISSATISSVTVNGPLTATGTVTLGSITSATTVTISSNAVMPGATFYRNGSVNLGTAGQTVTVSSNTILTGATFYQNGNILMGTPAQSVQFSSNTILPGTTFYQSGYTAISSATITHLTGVTTNSNGFLGDVGVTTQCVVSLRNVPTSGQWGDNCSLNLPAGDWLITAMVTVNLNGATIENNLMGIGTVTGNDGTGFVSGDTGVNISSSTAVNGGFGIVVPWRASIASQTSYFLKIKLTYGTATPQYAGRITAWKPR